MRLPDNKRLARYNEQRPPNSAALQTDDTTVQRYDIEEEFPLADELESLEAEAGTDEDTLIDEE
jgi:hypothetical protein